MSREKWLGGWAAAHFLFFALLWALPAIYAGITGKWVPRTPNEIQIFCGLTTLFASRSNAWIANDV